MEGSGRITRRPVRMTVESGPNHGPSDDGRIHADITTLVLKPRGLIA